MRTLIALVVACPLVVALSVVAQSLVPLPAAARDCAPVTLAGNAIAAGPSPLVLGVKDVATLTVAAHLQDTCSRIVAVQARVRSPKEDGMFDLGTGYRDPVSGMTAYGLELDLDPKTLFNTEAGAWTAVVTAREGASGPVASAPAPAFRIVRAAQLSLAIEAEAVTKGKPVRVTGTVERANWETGDYGGYAGRRVDLQFRTPTGAFAVVTTLTSGADGRIEGQVPAVRAGCYRLTYGGNRTTGPARSEADCVNIR